jgi:hypothetical protein
MSSGARFRAALARRGGAVFCGSWQPAHWTVSPGIAVIQLRISCNALPSPSSGWSESGVLAGMRNFAEPSAATGTVPSTRLMSHGPLTPIVFGLVTIPR